ncbi:MAG: hypothetical protein EHM19_07370 [Candidatus Latescibacterota bacterium]|nr:MAG: hypothetical protein EHM19_07370 [Candidatus Latescibacterota bacterium]
MNTQYVSSWVLAFLLTIGAASYQRRTGPTRPVTEEFPLGGRVLRAELLRSHGGPGDQPVEIDGAGKGAAGRIVWRRFPSREAFRTAEMRLDRGRLVGAIPHQPPAGKVEYRLELAAGADTIAVPASGTVVTRFKGAVPVWALVPHVIFMFAAMFVSNLAGIEAARRGPRLLGLTRAAVALLLLGGFVFGPIVQKHAFGSWWTGVPFGYDLTDNKTLLALLGWGTALFSFGRRKDPRRWVLAAALLMLAVFLVPHSLLGSELKPE